MFINAIITFLSSQKKTRLFKLCWTQIYLKQLMTYFACIKNEFISSCNVTWHSLFGQWINRENISSSLWNIIFIFYCIKIDSILFYNKPRCPVLQRKIKNGYISYLWLIICQKLFMICRQIWQSCYVCSFSLINNVFVLVLTILEFVTT